MLRITRVRVLYQIQGGTHGVLFIILADNDIFLLALSSETLVYYLPDYIRKKFVMFDYMCSV